MAIIWDKHINQFAPGNFAKKHVFKAAWLSRAKTNQKAFAGQSSVSDTKYQLPKFKDVQSQNSKFLGLKVTQRAVTRLNFFLLLYLAPLLFVCFSWPPYFSLLLLFFRLHFRGKVFWKAFRIVGFDGMSCGWNFRVN